VSTLKVAAINNPSASSGGLAISASGLVTGAGLDLIVTQSFSAASSVSLNNCFSADYDNYRLVIRAFSASGDIDTRMRLRASGTDATTSAYARQYIVGALTANSAGSSTEDHMHIMYSNAASGFGTVELNRPYVATPTMFWLQGGRSTAFVINSGYHNVSTAYDGFTLYPTSSTLTGTVSVYGYRK
jgi:hypothetical protein